MSASVVARHDFGYNGKNLSLREAPLPMKPDRAALWHALLDAADDYRKQAPWRWMDDTQVFGVRSPVGDEIGWCVVIGSLGQNFGLVLYPGDTGWRSFRAMQERWPTPEDAGVEQRNLSVTFEERNRLSLAMRPIFKELGRRHHGPRAWPDALDANSGYIPDLMTEGDLPWMTRALRKALEVARMTEGQPHCLAPDHRGRILLAERDPDGTEHWDRHETPIYQRPAMRPFRFDEVRAASIARTAERIEADWFVDRVRPFPVIIAELGTRPFFPHMLLVHDLGSDFIIAFRVLEDLDRDLGDELLASATQGLPRRFLVRRQEFLGQLAPIASVLGIAVHYLPELEAVSHHVVDRLRQAKP
ncbi:MAG: hypothetical protein H0W72_08660 [Planctomycetes bacterium]|nr:hypothetical protein [Planctomycetota bacterium]